MNARQLAAMRAWILAQRLLLGRSACALLHQFTHVCYLRVRRHHSQDRAALATRSVCYRVVSCCGRRHCRSQTTTEFTFWPFRFLPLLVIVRVFPSFEITECVVTLFPPSNFMTALAV